VKVTPYHNNNAELIITFDGIDLSDFRNTTFFMTYLNTIRKRHGTEIEIILEGLRVVRKDLYFI